MIDLYRIIHYGSYMLARFKTVFTRQPAKETNEDYHFKIPRRLMRMGIIDPQKKYNVWIEELDIIE